MPKLPPVPASGQRIVRSPAAGKLNAAILLLSASGTLTAASVAALAVLLGRATPGVSWLLVVGVPALVAGQFAMIAGARQRLGEGASGRRAQLAVLARPDAFFFGPLPRTVGWPLLAVAACGWLAAMASFAPLQDGGPGEPTATCPTVLENHGSVACVSREVWDQAGAAEQQLAGGVLTAFFALHTGAALGARHARLVARRRQR